MAQFLTKKVKAETDVVYIKIAEPSVSNEGNNFVCVCVRDEFC